MGHPSVRAGSELGISGRIRALREQWALAKGVEDLSGHLAYCSATVACIRAAHMGHPMCMHALLSLH